MGEPDRTADKTDVLSAQLSLEFAFVKQILSPILPAFSHKSIQPSASNGPQGLCAAGIWKWEKQCMRKVLDRCLNLYLLDSKEMNARGAG